MKKNDRFNIQKYLYYDNWKYCNLTKHPEYPFILCILVLTMFFSCSNYNEYHVQEWQNAFFLNDSTLGVIGWDYDLDESTNAMILSDYKNVRQIYYEYNLNTEELKEIFTLSSHEFFPDYYFYVTFKYPWIYYSTSINDPNAGPQIGIYNIETQENEIFKSEEGYSGLYPLIISKNGRYFGYEYAGHPDYIYSVYDLHENKDVINFEISRPLYIDDDSMKIVLKSNASSPNWFLLYDINTGKTDTLAENTFGVIDYHVTKDITLFKKDGVWKYFINEDLLKGNLEVHTIENLNMNKKGSCHINFRHC